MVQAIDNSMMRPVYNGVKINVTKPTVNAHSCDSVSNNNGIYNAVDINIDKPAVNTTCDCCKSYYDYPVADEPVNSSYAIAYQTSFVIPKENEMITVPAPNYTTIEDEKVTSPEVEKKNKSTISFSANTEVKRPEIIPSEDIKPEVDIPLVIKNLSSKDYDVQAMQMEEIVRLSLDDSEKAFPYIVRDVFTSLIDIASANTTSLPAPTDKQIDARRKIIANYMVYEDSIANNKQVNLPFNLTDDEMAAAEVLSPMEQAERNKEYALYTMSVLSKVYADEIEKATGNIVALTDLPGVSTMVDALRYSENPSVKIASINSLSYINRPEYKEELTALFTLAQADLNPEVAGFATGILESMKAEQNKVE